MSEQTKTTSKWGKSKIGGLWTFKDKNTGKVSGFSGEVDIGGKKVRVIVKKRLVFADDVPGKRYPDFNIFDADKLDQFSDQVTDLNNKEVKSAPKASTKKNAAPAEEPNTELV